MLKAIRIVEIIFAICAAGLWLWSANIPTPNIDLHWDGQAPEFLKALSRQSQLSGYAAESAAVAVFCQIAQDWLRKSN
jgi:hypothetical protein